MCKKKKSTTVEEEMLNFTYAYVKKTKCTYTKNLKNALSLFLLNYRRNRHFNIGFDFYMNH